MDSGSSFQNLQGPITTALIETTTSVKDLVAEDLAFHRSFDPALGREIDAQNRRLLKLAERLLASASTTDQDVGPKLPDIDAVDGRWRDIVDAIDSLLERADTSLDEFSGVIKKASTPAAEASPAARGGWQSQWTSSQRSDIMKPQKFFEVVPKNTETGPFEPLLTSKPHAIVPLATSLEARTEENGILGHEHPYKTEIEQYSFLDSVYTAAEPISYPPFESTSATFVDTEEALAVMLEELKTAKEIAIDLEHHDVRTYIGLTSLMQISTRNKDWIVDTLKPWRRRLECLNEVFADPKILKVFHGAQSDMIWLQRDFGLYVVGYFDTYYASRALRYPRGSLAFLLEKFVNVAAQKQYQTADWRVRPLPEPLFDYARSDTHFLLYIYDCMRNELLQKAAQTGEDLLQQVLNNSKSYALQRYEHPHYDPKLGMGASGWYKQLAKTPALLSKEQFAVFRAVHRWRDLIARQEDESVLFVMQNHTLFEIARSMPEEKAALSSIVTRPSGPVRNRMDELLAIILRAKDAGANGPAMASLLAEADAVAQQQRASRHAVQEAAAAPQATLPKSGESQTQHQIAVNTHAAVRADSSLFWGSAFPSVAKDNPPMDLVGVRLELPMPDLTADVLASGELGGGVPLEVAKAPPVPVKSPASADPANGFLVLRQHGRGKKRSADEMSIDGDSSSSSESDMSSSDSDSDEDSGGQTTAANGEQDIPNSGVPLGTPTQRSKNIRLSSTPDGQTPSSRQRKKQRKKEQRQQAKKNRKEHSRASQSSTVGEQQSPAQPFNYATAATVLHANDRGGPKQSKKQKNKQPQVQGMNPFAKMGDAPKGLGRAQKPRAGKSGTWAAGSK